jgi:hypothetical protein
MIFGTVFSSSSFIPINSFADMPGDSMDRGGSDGGNGDGQESSEDEKDNNDVPDSKEAPATAGSLTAGGDSDSDGDNDKDSGGNRDNDNEDDDDEPTSKDAPQTADTVTANKPVCPKGQEYYLFSASCKPVGGSDSTNRATSAPGGPPGINQPTAKYEPPAGTLPYKGNEVELINSYDKDRDVKHTGVKYGDNGQNIFRVFKMAR